jgi:hypothetical protein
MEIKKKITVTLTQDEVNRIVKTHLSNLFPDVCINVDYANVKEERNVDRSNNNRQPKSNSWWTDDDLWY